MEQPGSPGRIDQLAQTLRRREARIAAVLFVGFLALRLPFLSEYLVNWDAVQYALATQAFDLHHHQPHPPGYIGYVFLGRLLNYFTGDPNTSLSILSAVSGAIAPAALYILARCWMSRRYALAVAIMFGSTPLVWYYSGVALSYTVELAIAIPFVWASYRAISRQSPRDLLIATALVASLGAIRQTGMVLLLPLWAYTLWFFPWRPRIQAASLITGLTLLWLAPLLWLAGGPINYIEESRALADVTGGETSIFSLQFMGMARNLLYVSAGIIVGLNLGMLIIALTRRSGGNPLSVLKMRDRIFLFFWAAPALGTYLFGHTGQLGYILFILPPMFIWVGLALVEMARLLPEIETPSWARTQLGPVLTGTALLVIVAGTFTLVNSLGFLFLPSTATALGTPDSMVARHVRQYDLEASDTHWRNLVQLVERYDRETTAVLTTVGGPRISGSYRHLSYYLPEHRIYGLGRDRQGSFGYMFFSYDMANTYNIQGLDVARRSLALSETVHRVIIPDMEIVDMLDEQLPRYKVQLSDGSHAIVALLPEGESTLFFMVEEDEDGELVEQLVTRPSTSEPQENDTLQAGSLLQTP